MTMKGIAAALGIGAAAGAVAIMMTPRQSSARRVASKAATKVEDAANRMTQAVTNKLDSMDM